MIFNALQNFGNFLNILSNSLGNEFPTYIAVWGAESFDFTAFLFLFLDILQYIGVIILTLQLGKNYNMPHHILVLKLVNTSKLFIYPAIFINAIYIFGMHNFYLNVSAFSGLYAFNAATQILKFFLLVFLLAMYAILPVAKQNKNFRNLELPLLLHIILALSVTMLSSTNFALLLLSLEGVSLALYIMTALGRTYGGITASVKYFAFGTLGSIFLFWGVVHIYAIVPTLSMDFITYIFDHPFYFSDTDSLNFAVTAISFGFMLKLGAAPVHQWVADTYAGVHLYITAYFSIFVKLVIFVLFLKVGVIFNYDALLLQFSILSLVIGCFMSINQSEIKRLLAYSSIVHVGFLLMGDVCGSLIYLITYLISSLLLFIVLLDVKIADNEIVYLNDFRYIRTCDYKGPVALIVALSSSAGLPPFSGFYGKFAVWSSIIEDIYLTNDLSAYSCLFASVGVTLLTIFYYMRVISYVFICSDSNSLSSITTVSFKNFYEFFLSLEGALIMIVLFWSFLHPLVIKLVQILSVFI